MRAYLGGVEVDYSKLSAEELCNPRLLVIWPMKLCIDCKWFGSAFPSEVAGVARAAGIDIEINDHCTHEASVSVEVVRGRKSYKRCDNMRSVSGQCCPSGKLWEPKD